MIVFKRVSKRYARDREALTDLNFHIRRGEMIFITGHSGAGKSTLLKLLTLEEKASGGQILCENQNLAQFTSYHTMHWRRRLGIIAQTPNLLNDRNIFTNISLPLNIIGYRPPEIKRRVHAALDKVGLLNKVECYPQQLSAGEQQRVSIARAIIHKPHLVLADEPTGNLDPQLSNEIMQLFAAFNQVGVTVLIASHDLALIASMPYRILKLHQGRLVNMKTAENIA